MIKAIETSYKGFRFRSRLEARWAVAFDHMGLTWEYEKQGLNVDGTPYLPDFWIENWLAWVEIKPKDGTDKGIKLCMDLSKYDEVFMIRGNPWPDEYEVLQFQHGHLIGNMEFKKTDSLQRAFNAARSARFEHGEHG